MAEEVKMFGFWASPFSNRVELALNLKGIQYEFIEENLQNKSRSFLKYNPITKKIPVIVHNEKSIIESLVILEYIEETWKDNPLLPQDPHERALARFWANFIDDKIIKSAHRIATSSSKEREDAIEENVENLKLLEKELAGKDFFGGNSIGYIDIAASVIAIWFGVGQEVSGLHWFTQEEHPNLWKWKTKFEQDEVVKQCCPPKHKLVEFMKMLTASGSAPK
ncbi:probable glutathione S-transferase [Rutidosis leptorrhynchoides]|uniref:probable glutathione S-transferase n=1 Tax=Rutidosis leptorrhynchoides TaxID=125765 RepID=UPI003A9A6403